MEYDGWSHTAAINELKAHGFGDSACNAANDYLTQYILNYRRRAWLPVAIESSPDLRNDKAGNRVTSSRHAEGMGE